jgi:hypothetical protein
VVCHGTLLRGSCNDDITPGPAALRDIKPVYVAVGSKQEAALSGLCLLGPGADIGERKTRAQPQLRLQRCPFADQAATDSDAETNAELLIAALAAQRFSAAGRWSAWLD